MIRFIYHEPETLNEAVSLLNELRGDAKIKAGGTDLLIKMKKEVVNPSHLINLKNSKELAYINYCSKVGLKIGALTTLSEIENSMIVKEKFSLLWQAASKVASPQIRNGATLGGNICLDSRCLYYNQSRQWLLSLEPCYKRKGNRCHILGKGSKCYSIFSADTVPALIALMAKIKLMNCKGERVITVEDFYTGIGMKVNKIQPDEILTEIQIPEIDEKTKSVYLKISERGEVDFPVLGVAASIVLNENKILEKLDLVIIGTGPRPIRLSKIEGKLRGQRASPEIIEEACGEIPDVVHSISNAFGWADYKRKILPSLVSQSIMKALLS
jgi:4-hydroxybenzoyl-CoA reductase subunit beta